jgi:hypothetical protein
MRMIDQTTLAAARCIYAIKGHKTVSVRSRIARVSREVVERSNFGLQFDPGETPTWSPRQQQEKHVKCPINPWECVYIPEI